MSNNNNNLVQVLCPSYLCNRKKVPNSLVEYKKTNTSTNEVQESLSMRYANLVRIGNKNRIYSNTNPNQTCSFIKTYKQTNTKFVPATNFLCIKYI